MKDFMIVLVLVAALGMVDSVAAQSKRSNEKDAVLAAVQQFFDAMTARDVAASERVLISEGRFASFRIVDGKQVMRLSSNQDYLNGLPSGKERWRERMWNPEVRIHGPIANVWTPYDFWIDGKFSHCGIDSFDLVKVDGQWKIAGGTYTVETTCKTSPLGPLKEK